jgi:hypothetical protein
MVSVIFIDFQLFCFLSRIIPYYKQYYNNIFKFSYFLLVPITECTGINALTPETSTPGTESFSMSTLTALVTVKTELGYDMDCTGCLQESRWKFICDINTPLFNLL